MAKNLEQRIECSSIPVAPDPSPSPPEKAWKVPTAGEDIASYFKTMKQNITNAISEEKESYWIYAFVFVFALQILYNLFRFGKSIYLLDYSNFGYGFFFLIGMLLPFGVFIWSTKFTIWNYRRNKIGFLYLCIFNLVLYLIIMIMRILHVIFVPLILKMPLVEGITPYMIVNLARGVVLVPCLICAGAILNSFYQLINSDSVLADIYAFRLNKLIDTRENKSNLYDSAIIRRMSGGSRHIIRESDRFLHFFISGATGSGKTSSTILPQAAEDLDKRIQNEDTQKKELLKALKEKKVYMKEGFTDEDFNIDKFGAYKGYEDVINNLKSKHVVCGATFVAPNYGLTDDVYELCEKRGIKCNRIDPELDPDTNLPKKGVIGFNPLYISPTLSPLNREFEIIKKAKLFADVMQAINELNGKGDPYFTSINRVVTTSFTILLELTYPLLHGGEQPTPADVQSLINDFSRVQPYYQKLLEIDVDNKYEFVKDFLRNDILGAGNEKMTDQSRGLRNQVNEILTNPLIRSILCAKNSVDMDLMLSEGQVTVVNYGLSLGTTDSTALGLFFVLSFNDAVLRRPGNEKTRIPHFYTIDELPVLLHPEMEKMFSLFRQYRVSVAAYVQNLDQFNKTPMTQFLLGVVMGNCAHHIIFGRAGLSEMKAYSDLSGLRYSYNEQTSVSETALSDENTRLAYSTRTALEKEAVIDGADMRYRDFQEVTVFSLVSGSLVEPFHAKMNFLPRYKKKKVKRFSPNWSEYFDATNVEYAKDVEQSPIPMQHTSEQMRNTIPVSQVTSTYTHLEHNQQSEEDRSAAAEPISNHHNVTTESFAFSDDSDVLEQHEFNCASQEEENKTNEEQYCSFDFEL